MARESIIAVRYSFRGCQRRKLRFILLNPVNEVASLATEMGIDNG